MPASQRFRPSPDQVQDLTAKAAQGDFTAIIGLIMIWLSQKQRPDDKLIERCIQMNDNVVSQQVLRRLWAWFKPFAPHCKSYAKSEHAVLSFLLSHDQSAPFCNRRFAWATHRFNGMSPVAIANLRYALKRLNDACDVLGFRLVKPRICGQDHLIYLVPFNNANH
jgi:hypothetical protein